jgi:uroporphyrinogen decarboxylase
MGGLDRHGVLATGDRAAIRQAANEVLAQAPERFILAADCTVPSETPWDNLKAAVDAAHEFRR